MDERPRLTVGPVAGFYGVLALGAILWDALRSGPSGLLPGPDALDAPRSVALALAFSALVIFVSRLLDRRFAWSRRVSEEIAGIVGPLGSREIAIFSFSSGLAEEMFFRGAMQPSLGLVATSLIFGVCHGYFERRLVPWMVMATVVGFGLGVLAELTGSLLAPILAHFTINYFEFHALDKLARGQKP